MGEMPEGQRGTGSVRALDDPLVCGILIYGTSETAVPYVFLASLGVEIPPGSTGGGKVRS